MSHNRHQPKKSRFQSEIFRRLTITNERRGYKIIKRVKNDFKKYDISFRKKEPERKVKNMKKNKKRTTSIDIKMIFFSKRGVINS